MNQMIPGGRCMDCKWPNESKVAKACSCHLSKDYVGEVYLHELAEAKHLHKQGVPFNDPRYYPDPDPK
jgi:hypothetical protein